MTMEYNNTTANSRKNKHLNDLKLQYQIEHFGKNMFITLRSWNISDLKIHRKVPPELHNLTVFSACHSFHQRTIRL